MGDVVNRRETRVGRENEPTAAGVGVSVVMTTYNENPRYLAEAIESVLSQTVPADEIIVVDDGSATRDPAPVLARYPQLTVIRQSHRGLAGARNTGWRAASGKYVVFLDSDDRLMPEALAFNLRRFASEPRSAFVYGDHRLIDGEGRPITYVTMPRPGSDPYATMLQGNCIGMHATVMYRRQVLEAVGGFDESLPSCEDYDLYLRIARSHTVASGREMVAEYRRHDANMSRDLVKMLRTALQVLAKQQAVARANPAHRKAYEQGRSAWKAFYVEQQLRRVRDAIRQREPVGPPLRDSLRIWMLAPWAVPGTVIRQLGSRLRARVGRRRVDFGSLGGLEPVSREFGFDRGKPVDRRYIEQFLLGHKYDIRGHVLEVGDSTYTREYGEDRVSRSDVLHIDPGAKQATWIADLADGRELPSNTFDCVILTQTLHLIFDLARAVATLHRILKPGGVALVTVPGVSSVDRGEWGRTWYWSMTAASLERLLSGRFASRDISVSVFGNVKSAVAFLHGLAEHELRPPELDACDPQYPVIVAARVVKGPEASDAPRP